MEEVEDVKSMMIAKEAPSVIALVQEFLPESKK